MSLCLPFWNSREISRSFEYFALAMMAHFQLRLFNPHAEETKGNKTKTSCALIKEYIRKTGWVTGAGWRLFKFSSSCFSSTIYIHSVRCIIQRYKHIASNILLFTRQRNIGRQHKDVWPSERFR